MQRIDIKYLTKQYELNGQSIPALGPVNLSISNGDFICIVGESGCGKTTLWRILAGLECATNGVIEEDGRTLGNDSFTKGLVFQNNNLLPWLNVRENIELSYRIKKKSINKDLVDEMLNLVGMMGFEKAKPHQLSGGMAQRVAIARALIGKPDILLFDEPFAALDPFTRIRLQSELLQIWHQKETTVVFITHDIDEALTLATKVVLLTPRPGQVAKIFDVPLPYPRDRTSSEIVLIKNELLEDYKILTFQN